MPQNDRPPLEQLLGSTKRAALAEALTQVARQHHDALALELFGAQAAGLTSDALAELVDAGLVDPDKIGGFHIPGTDFDIFEFVARVARYLEAAPVAEQAKMRRWSLAQWSKAVQTAPAPPTPSSRAPSAIPGGVHVTLPTYTAPPSGAQVPLVGEAPAWMGPAERGAWLHARERAASFCRGLGNRVADDLDAALAEAWRGEEIVAEVQPRLRSERVQQISDALADALATHRSADRMAADLGRATGNWSHNWQRIAETEMQGALNEGVVLAAVEDEGPGALVARVPETDACEDCLRVFLDDEGDVRVFRAAELIANGTNVGKRRADWQPTIWPVHPRCRCGTLSVPEGYRVTRSGALRREGR